MSPSNSLRKIKCHYFYPPPYKRLVWHYQETNRDLLKQATELFDWEKSLSNLEVNKEVSVFNETIINIFENFIPYKTITRNNKDPLGITYCGKNALYKHLKRRMLSSKLFDKLDALQGKLQSSTNFFQFVYYRKISKQLSDPSTNPKCYWNVLKTLLNGTKIPCIPPLFQDNKFITDFKEKSKTFNSFFAKQCSLIANGSTLPSLFPLIKEKSPANIDFSVDDIKNIINKLDSNKVHGDDMISILMLKLCDKSICKPLNIIFKSSLIFPKSSLISKNQSEFKPGDSCVTNY